MNLVTMQDIKLFTFIGALFLVCTCVTGTSEISHKCIHDEIAKKYPLTSIPHMNAENDRNRRQADDYHPYRILVYFVDDYIDSSSTFLLTNPSEGFQSAINYLQSVLSVIRAPHNLTIPPSCATTNYYNQCTSLEPQMCGPFTIPDEHLGAIIVCDPTCHKEGGGVDADYILYTSAYNEENCTDNTLAYAAACLMDSENNRPLAGFTNICPQGLTFASYKPQGFFRIMLHEILHAVGFTSDLFKLFRDENGDQYSGMTTLKINGADASAVNSPKVLSYGRKYYSCPNLQGVLLENEGGAGSASSHWEFRTLGYEIMNAGVPVHDSTSISNFTLSVLEDSGWYKVNYKVAESLYNYETLWGKGLGCSFITADCDTWPYSCSPLNTRGCSYDYQITSYCYNGTYSDGCYYFNQYLYGFCNLPGVQITNSKSCFPVIHSNGTVHDDLCYDRQCYRYSGAQKLFYTVEESGYAQLCLNDGAQLTIIGDGSVLTCPPAEAICSRNASIILLDSSNIPSSLCDDSCATCSKPVNPAYCLTCNSSLTLRGAAPGLCTADTCSEGTFQDSFGNCVACAAGCRACTGPNNSDCMACEDETLYRVTTNNCTSSACITAAECATPVVSTFGDCICNMINPTSQGGGANSIQYHQLLLLFSLLVYFPCLCME